MRVFVSAGRAPFEVEDPVETAQRIMHSPPVCGFPRGTSPECISFIQQARVNTTSALQLWSACRTQQAAQFADRIVSRPQRKLICRVALLWVTSRPGGPHALTVIITERQIVPTFACYPMQALRKQPAERPSAAAMLEHPWVRRCASAAAASTGISGVGRPRAVLASVTNMTAQHVASAGARAIITIKPSVAAKARPSIKRSDDSVLRCQHSNLLSCMHASCS